MFLDLQVGNLTESLTGRAWDRPRIWREYCQRVAYFRNHGLAFGDRVLVHYGNTLEFFVDLLSIWALGGCVIPIDLRLTAFEVENVARVARPRFSLWLGRPDPPIATALSALNVTTLETPTSAPDNWLVSTPACGNSLVIMDQPALILFTSGTTGDPKGVVHTHRSLRAKWLTLWHCLGTEKFRRTLCVLPTHFGHGLICNCLFPWLFGQDLFVTPSFRPEVLTQLGAILDAHAITFLSSVPSMWRMVLRTARPPALGHVRRVICGSAPLSAELWRDIQDWAGTTDVLNAYGITEVGSWVAGTTVPKIPLEDGLIGVPWGAVAKILKISSTENGLGGAVECAPGETGYMWLNTPALMKGYLDRDDLTNRVVAQGWFFTGDIGLVDDRGLLFLRGREREEINKGGMKVCPADIDRVAERFEGTVDVCAFGYEDPLHGEDVGIAMVLQTPSDETIRGLYDFLRQHLAKFQMPQRWYLLEEIPRTSRGKVNRSRVAQACASLDPLDHRSIVRERSELS